MGGSGSGNTSARDARPTTAERARLDIRAWRRADLLAGRGDAGEWREWCPGGGLRVQVVDLAPAPSPGAPPALALRLARTRQPGGAAAVEVHSWIDLAWTPCQFGGHRPWFVCPGEAGGAPCGRQAAILYDAGGLPLPPLRGARLPVDAPRRARPAAGAVTAPARAAGRGSAPGRPAA